MQMNKLKQREVKEYREQQLLKQGNCCALCGDKIIDDAVLDHDHKTGLVRQVLHRGCNSLLGKIENNMPRSQVDINRLKGIAHNLIGYIITTHSETLHPTHRTHEERKQLAKKRAKRRKQNARA
jgi:hypothetical protein